jgi:hypothetical protein
VLGADREGVVCRSSSGGLAGVVLDGVGCGETVGEGAVSAGSVPGLAQRAAVTAESAGRVTGCLRWRDDALAVQRSSTSRRSQLDAEGGLLWRLVVRVARTGGEPCEVVGEIIEDVSS